MIFYQGWNLLLCFYCADLRDMAMIIHHALVTVLAYTGLYPYVHSDAMFFFGVAELTNVPLTIIDIFKYLPELKAEFPKVMHLHCCYHCSIVFVERCVMLCSVAIACVLIEVYFCYTEACPCELPPWTICLLFASLFLIVQ